MKLSVSLLVAVFFCTTTAWKSNAQLYQDKSTVTWEITVWNDEAPDLISGQFDVHYIVHIKNGNILHWTKIKYITGEAISQSTGEKFRANFILKSDGIFQGEVTERSFHFNLVGENGTHYIMALTLEIDWTGESIEYRISKLKEKLI